MKDETKLTKVGGEFRNPYGYVNPPIFKGSTVLYETVQDIELSQNDSLKKNPPVYGRFGNPTGNSFEKAMAEIENGYDTVSTCSGLAAVTTSLLAFVKSKDHILIPDSVYWPTKNFCLGLKNLGVEVEFYHPQMGAKIETLIRPETKVIYLESPGSILFEIQDVPAIVEVAKRYKIITMIDNTCSTPLNFKPLNFGVDISLHSATKFISGHSDSFLGVIICNEATYPVVRKFSMLLGQCASSEDMYQGLRGLRTMAARMQKQEQNALTIAKWLRNRNEVEQVFYAPLERGENNLLWKRDFQGASSLFSILLKPQFSKNHVDQMLNSLKIFGMGFSYGGFESLIVPMDPNHWRKYPVISTGQKLLRIYIGLEHVDDLINDLESAFKFFLKR